MFVAFKIALVYGEDKHWINDSTSIFDNKEINLFNTGIFKNYELVVDFSKPEDSQNIISDMVNSVENECPVGKYFGISGVGEGIVFLVLKLCGFILWSWYFVLLPFGLMILFWVLMIFFLWIFMG